MKRLFTVFAFLIAISNVYANNDLVIEDSRIIKSEVFELVKKWVVVTLDSYDATISYEDKSSGNIIVKGMYKDDDNILMAKILKYVIPYVSFQLEIQCDDGKLTAHFNKIEYSYVSLDEDSYGLSNRAIKTIISELEAIKYLMIRKGETWVIDDSFEKEYEGMKLSMKQANEGKDNTSLSRKERREFNQYYENNKAKYNVLEYAVEAKNNAGNIILTKNNDGLLDVINHYLENKLN